MDFFDLLTMIGGLALFLYGMQLMGDGLKKTSGGKMEYILETLTSNKLKAILLGAGNLGRAVIEHMDFSGRGIDVIGIFDIDKSLVGKTVGNVEIFDSDTISEFCEKNEPTVAILCITKESAIKQADILISRGIKAFWNFSHYDLTIDYDGIAVENVHLGDSLSILCYKVKELENN